MLNTYRALKHYGQAVFDEMVSGVWPSYGNLELTATLRLQPAAEACDVELKLDFGYYGIVWAVVLPVDAEDTSVGGNGLLEAQYLAGLAQQVGDKFPARSQRPSVRLAPAANDASRRLHQDAAAQLAASRKLRPALDTDAQANTVTLSADASDGPPHAIRCGGPRPSSTKAGRSGWPKATATALTAPRASIEAPS